MDYFFTKISRRIDRYFRKYILVLLQVVIGIAFLYVSFTIWISLQTSYNKAEELPQEKLLQLEYTYSYDNNEDVGKWQFFSYDDYEWLRNNYSKDTYVYIDYRKGGYLSYSSDEGTGFIKVAYVSNDFFKVNLNDDNASFDNTAQVIAGDNVIDFLQNEKEGKIKENDNKLYEEIIWGDKELPELKINSKVYELKSLSSMNNYNEEIQLKYFTLSGGADDINDSLDDYIFIPFEDSGFTYASDFGSVKFGIAAKDGSDPRMLKAAHDLYTRLYTRDGYRYNYFFNTGGDMLKTQTLGNKLQSQKFMNLAIISLLVITVGLIGLLAALTRRRYKELAICLSAGATKIRLAFEILTESLLITLTGGIGGSGIGWFIINLDLFKYSYFVVRQDYRVLFFCILISIFISIIGSLFPFIKIIKIMPTDVLKES